MIDRPNPKLQTEEGADCWLGANFWSRAGGPDMWLEFDPELVEEELCVLADHGVNVVRSFFVLSQFMPEPGEVDEHLVEHFWRFLDLCGTVGVRTIPTFVVGHMSGENRDLPWRNGRDLYRDGFMLAQQALFVRTLTRRFATHPAIAGWLLSNEMTLYAGPTDPDSAWAWAELLVQAVRAGGGRQPVSTGDGAWGMEITGRDNGFRLRRLQRVVDWVGPHIYPLERDEWRQLLAPAFTCELAHLGRPVVLEEFGATSAFANDDNVAAYYRQVLHTTLLAGATGWLAWNSTDFALVDADPYRHHPFELRFGLTDAAGQPKPALAEIAAFRSVLDEIDLERCRRAPAAAAIVVTSHFEVDYPFTDREARPPIRDVLLQSYVSARAADLGPAVVREADGIPLGDLLIVPSTQALTGPGWRTLRDHAEAGGTVYVSYFSGHVPFHRGLWHPDLDGYFGVRHGLRYGLVDFVDEDEVVWRFERPFGDLEAGEQLRFEVSGNEHGRSRLPVEPDGAEVVARDSAGRPALLEHRVGQGAIVLSTYPVEYLAATRARVNPNDIVRLYRALACRAGCQAPVRATRPDVHVDRLIRDDGSVLVWFVSYADETVEIRPELGDGLGLWDLHSREPIETVTLAPRGVAIAELRPLRTATQRRDATVAVDRAPSRSVRAGADGGAVDHETSST